MSRLIGAHRNHEAVLRPSLVPSPPPPGGASSSSPRSRANQGAADGRGPVPLPSPGRYVWWDGGSHTFAGQRRGGLTGSSDPISYLVRPHTEWLAGLRTAPPSPLPRGNAGQ